MWIKTKYRLWMLCALKLNKNIRIHFHFIFATLVRICPQQQQQQQQNETQKCFRPTIKSKTFIAHEHTIHKKIDDDAQSNDNNCAEKTYYERWSHINLLVLLIFHTVIMRDQHCWLISCFIVHISAVRICSLTLSVCINWWWCWRPKDKLHIILLKQIKYSLTLCILFRSSHFCVYRKF